MIWRCTICGLIHEGLTAPAKCPKCGRGPEKFVPVTAEELKALEEAK